MNKKINPKISALLVIFAGVLWGVTSIFVKGLDGFGLNSMEIGVLRTGICTALLFHHSDLQAVAFQNKTA